MKAFLNIALPKGRLGEKAYKMLKESGYNCPEIENPGRKLIFENTELGVRYFWVKPSDVAIYVERGAADGLALLGDRLFGGGARLGRLVGLRGLGCLCHLFSP